MRGLGSCVLRSSHSHSVFKFSSQSIQLSLGVNCIWMDIFIRWLPKDLLSRPHLRHTHTQQIPDSLTFLNSNIYISVGGGGDGEMQNKLLIQVWRNIAVKTYLWSFSLQVLKSFIFNGDSKTWAGTQIKFIMEEITLILE